MSLYHKYRPKTLDAILGNELLIDTLKTDLQKEDPPHAYLLHGPTGCGKTTIGRIIGTMLGCTNRDFHEIDSADFRGIDTIRDIRHRSRFKSIYGNKIVWLIDECHKLTNDAQNALLKALEDPAKHVYYILATTDKQKLLDTIKGRCSQYQVNPLSDSDMLRLLRHVVKEESKEVPRQVLEQIITDSQGYPRNALQILDQIIEIDPEKMLEVAKRQAEEQSQVIELCRALLAKAPWKKISRILKEIKDQDPESVRRAILGYCNSVLLNNDNVMAAVVMEQMIEPFYSTGWPGLTFACYSIVK